MDFSLPLQKVVCKGNFYVYSWLTGVMVWEK